MDKNEILANFQACTGNDDIAESMSILEQCEWNLHTAVNLSIGAQGTDHNEQRHGSASNITQPDDTMLTFSCKLGGIVKDVSLLDSNSVGLLKQIASIELGIPVEETEFERWPVESAVQDPSDETLLSALHLPHLNQMTIRTYSPLPLVSLATDSNDPLPVPCSAFPLSAGLTTVYKLSISNEDNQQVKIVEIEGSKSFKELKQEVASFTDISPRFQIWKGFPTANSPNEQSTLASLKLSTPIHNLSVASAPPAPNPPKPPHIIPTHTNGGEMEDSSDEEDDMFVDATNNMDDDDFIFASSPANSRLNQLMPEKAVDDRSALQQFKSEFMSRYEVGPDFVTAPLKEATTQAFGTEARNRKLLAIYIHHDQSIQANVFCSQLLCKEAVISYLSEHFVTWAWDVTSPFNKEKFLQECTQYLGSGVANTIKKVKKDNFPLLLVAHGRGRQCEVTAMIQANCDLNELMAKLVNAVEEGCERMVQDIKEEV
uniref:UAS domain-containing protein n=1 Tax=Ciona savignyi TaxID=51511 RepID=H2YK07_CIOSA